MQKKTHIFKEKNIYILNMNLNSYLNLWIQENIIYE